jgi:hypothetical protein
VFNNWSTINDHNPAFLEHFLAQELVTVMDEPASEVLEKPLAKELVKIKVSFSPMLMLAFSNFLFN